MTLAEIMEECPSLEHFLRLKQGQFARMIDRALLKMVDDINDPNKQADGKRTLRVTVTGQPEADRSSVRFVMDDPTVAEAKSKAPAVAQMFIVETTHGAKLCGSDQDLRQEAIPQTGARGNGLHAEEVC